MNQCTCDSRIKLSKVNTFYHFLIPFQGSFHKDTTLHASKRDLVYCTGTYTGRVMREVLKFLCTGLQVHGTPICMSKINYGHLCVLSPKQTFESFSFGYNFALGYNLSRLHSDMKIY